MQDLPPLWPQIDPACTWCPPVVRTSWPGQEGQGAGEGSAPGSAPPRSSLDREPPARPVGVQAGLRGPARGLWGPNVPLSLEIGLCVSMRSQPWYVQANPDSFFPRCYGLCTESEKQEFLGKFGAEAEATWRQGPSVVHLPLRGCGSLWKGGGLGHSCRAGDWRGGGWLRAWSCPETPPQGSAPFRGASPDTSTSSTGKAGCVGGWWRLWTLAPAAWF